MHVHILGAERRIDEFDLLAPVRLHPVGGTLIQMENLEHRLLLCAARSCVLSRLMQNGSSLRRKPESRILKPWKQRVLDSGVRRNDEKAGLDCILGQTVRKDERQEGTYRDLSRARVDTGSAQGLR